jgi:[acyl-carrier-protein] S-malonyltransferase
MSFAAVFPGQGSQSVGMLSALATRDPLIAQTFAEASAAIDLDLWRLASEGPKERLDQTQNTQPALLAANVAVYRAWRAAGGAEPSALAGHSLGEYAAYVCAEAITLADAARLVRLRGELMQRAVPEGSGAMAAVLNADDAQLEAICAEAAQGDIVAPANFNAPGQTVISGSQAAVERAIALLKAAGIKRVIPLAVSVPSHCRLMDSICAEFAAALTKIDIRPPRLTVIANVDGQPHRGASAIRDTLVEQLRAPVRWVDSVRALGARRIIECGPGKVLSGLIKRIDSTIEVQSIGEPDAFDAALALGASA